MPVGLFHIHKQDSRRIVMLNECWSTHTQRGYKMKGGKQVPNCVPKGMKEEIHMSDITNKFTNKVMEAIVLQDPRMKSAAFVGGKGKSVGGQRPEPSSTDMMGKPSQDMPTKDYGDTTAERRTGLAKTIRNVRKPILPTDATVSVSRLNKTR